MGGWGSGWWRGTGRAIFLKCTLICGLLWKGCSRKNLLRILRDNTGVSIGMDAKKDLPVDMGENFPYPGPCDRTKASTVLPRWECFITVPEMTARYGAVLISQESMERGVLGDIRGGGV